MCLYALHTRCTTSGSIGIGTGADEAAVSLTCIYTPHNDMHTANLSLSIYRFLLRMAQRNLFALYSYKNGMTKVTCMVVYMERIRVDTMHKYF